MPISQAQLVWLLSLLALPLPLPLASCSSDAICQLVARQHHACQVHRVSTADGYQLSLQRIPPANSSRCRSARARQPFLLMHGLIGSAGDFVVAGPARSLAYLLHSSCFDVWLANARGTTHSRRHRALHAQQPAFWDFSFHEIGVYDLPALVQHVLAVTHSARLHYVGHSQGSTVLLVLLAQQPAYNERLASVTMLAPVAYLQHLSSPPLRLLAQHSERLALLLNQLGLNELLPATPLTQLGGRLLCGASLPTHALCQLLASLYVGFSDYPLDHHTWPRILETTPAGISRQQLLHFGQLINSGNFQQYDCGSRLLNEQRYGQPTPPAYALSQVRVPLQLYYGTGDALATRTDVERLAGELINSRVTLHRVQGYNHIDFLYATTAAGLIYSQIIRYATQFDNTAGQTQDS